jgi:hypothetical protein
MSAKAKELAKLAQPTETPMKKLTVRKLEKIETPDNVCMST